MKLDAFAAVGQKIARDWPGGRGLLATCLVASSLHCFPCSWAPCWIPYCLADGGLPLEGAVSVVGSPVWSHPTGTPPAAEGIPQAAAEGPALHEPWLENWIEDLPPATAPILSPTGSSSRTPAVGPVPTLAPPAALQHQEQSGASRIDVQPAPEPPMLLLAGFAGLIWLLFWRKSCTHKAA